jgi:hypothetical protein
VDVGYTSIIHYLPPYKVRGLANLFHEGGGSDVLHDRVGVVCILLLLKIKLIASFGLFIVVKTEPFFGM